MKKLFIFIFIILNSINLVSQNWEEVGNGAAIHPCIFADTVNNQFLAYRLLYNSENDTIFGLAKLQDEQWVEFDTSLNFSAACKMILHNDKLIITSSLPQSSDTSSIIRWDNPGWTIIGQYNNAIIRDMQSINDSLYITGWLGNIDGVSVNRIAKWTEPGWSPVGSPTWFFAEPYTMAKFQDNIYVAGSFVNDDGTCCIAKWNGVEWSGVGEGIIPYSDITLDPAITKLIIYKDELYILGNFNKADNNAGNFIMRWDGENFKDVGGGLDGTPHDAVVFKDELYVVGFFGQAGGVQAHTIAKWDGEQWCGSGSIFGGPLREIEIFNDELYVSGSFQSIDGLPIKRIAKWIGGNFIDSCGAIVTGIEEQIDINYDEIKVYPNPASDFLKIKYPDFQSESKLTLQIYNMLGQEMYLEEKIQQKRELDISFLPLGIYWIRFFNNQNKYSNVKSFIIHK